MADESASPPRKVGSLRNRIAQFEQKPAAPAPPPKPAAPKKSWAWKDKQAETTAGPPAPPPAPAAASVADSSEPASAPAPVAEEQDKSSAGFSADDARAAISHAGGLKARLAALQGSGFGAPVDTSPVPPPVPGKPRVWKAATIPYEPQYPKPTRPVEETEEQTEATHEEAQAEESAAAPVESEDAEAQPLDPEEEERQRRANIAARMARLGGARVGMPIVFGKKPVPTPPRKESAPEPQPVEETIQETPPAPPPPAPAVIRRPSVEKSTTEATEWSRTTTTFTESSETATEEPSETTEDDDQTEDEAQVPVPSSPPRARPPVPLSRDWSRSPPASPKPVRAESQDAEHPLEKSGLATDSSPEELAKLQRMGEAAVQPSLGPTTKAENEIDLGEEATKTHVDSEEISKPLHVEVPYDQPRTTSPATVPLPESVRPRSGSGTPPTSGSPASSMPLPAMPRRAAPPRRKAPTPKASSDSQQLPTPAKSASRDSTVPETGEQPPTESITISDEHAKEQTPVETASGPEEGNAAEKPIIPDARHVQSPPADSTLSTSLELHTGDREPEITPRQAEDAGSMYDQVRDTIEAGDDIDKEDVVGTVSS